MNAPWAALCSTMGNKSGRVCFQPSKLEALLRSIMSYSFSECYNVRKLRASLNFWIFRIMNYNNLLGIRIIHLCLKRNPSFSSKIIRTVIINLRWLCILMWLCLCLCMCFYPIYVFIIHTDLLFLIVKYVRLTIRLRSICVHVCRPFRIASLDADTPPPWVTLGSL